LLVWVQFLRSGEVKMPMTKSCDQVTTITHSSP
jgi:hypothetical protein